MPTFTQDWTASLDSSFIQRVTMSMLSSAQAISAEATSTPDHANRVALMKLVTNNPGQWGPVFAAACAAQGIDGTATDTTINNTVSAIWNSLAGVP